MFCWQFPMKRAKRYSILGCLLTTLLIAAPAFSQVVLNADFEADIPGNPPNLSPAGNPPGDSLVLARADEAGNSALVVGFDSIFPTQSLEFIADGTDMFFYGLPDPGLGPYSSGKYEVAWTSSVSSLGPGGGPIIGLLSVGTFRFGVVYWTDLSIKITDAPSGFLDTTATYQLNVAQSFRAVVDFDSGVYDLFIDGILVGGNLPLRDAGGFDRFAMTIPHLSDVRIDDIRIGRGPTAILVEIDIKPGGVPNSINLGSHGTVPVAILSSAEFDASTVDPNTVELAGARVEKRGKGKLMASLEDVNSDGLLDLIVHVSTEDLQLSHGDTIATMTGQSYEGEQIQGSDSVHIVP